MNDSSVNDATAILTDQNESEVAESQHHHKQVSKIKKSTKSSSSSSSTSKRSSNRQKSKHTASNCDAKPSTSAAKKTPKNRHQTHEDNDDENFVEGTIEKEPSRKTTTRQPKSNTAITINEASSLPPSPRLNGTQARDLRKITKDAFDYTLKDTDIRFIEELYRQLPILISTWDRIGFNETTKNERLEKFYDNITERLEDLVDGEEELEEKILDDIKCHMATLKTLCFDLQIKNAEDPKNKPLNFKPRTIMDEEAHLRKEVKRLEAEKTIRVNNFKKLALIESSLCDTLKMVRTQMVKNIPSEADIARLATRIEDMERERVQRLAKMTEYKEKCICYNNDLDVSQSDSFAEQILFEEPATMSLGDKDLERASEFLEELRRKHDAAQDEIRTLRVKIKELWEKLKIDNINLKEVVYNNSSNNVSKRTLCIELRKEYERCVKIKMENMQKYIENVRDEIRIYTEKMFIGSKELQTLDMLRSTNFNEDLLEQHEEKLEDYKFKYEENATLYEKCTRWIDMWAEFVAFEEKTKDPLRLKQRGYNMLTEEKERKTYNAALPKLEEDIQRLAAEYKETNGGQAFKIFNDSYDDYIYKKRLDHEESKKTQRIEKQIMKTIINKNETRYGSKPATPLALQQIKRKQQETLLQTPGSRAKMQKIDSTISSQPTPNTRLFASKTSTAKPSAYGIGAAKSKLTMNKRKSKTPKQSARLLRRSRQIAANAALTQDADATVLSSDSTTKTTSLMSTIMSSTNGSTCSTNASSTNKTNTHGAAAVKKGPPVSSSSKFALNYNQKTLGKQSVIDTSKFGITRMTSTASNTFIEEENLENIENYPSDSVLSGNKHTALLSAVSAKLSGGGGVGFSFQAPTSINKLHSEETDYHEFTSQLQSHRFGGHKDEADFAKPTQVLTNHNSKVPTLSANSLTSTRSSKYK